MLRRLILLAAFIATPAVAQIARGVDVSAADYPADVTPGPRPFTTKVRYTLTETGTIASCAVVRSSGQPSLDAESCRILTTRARIRPERRTMHGILDFRWLNENSRRPGHFRGEPIPYSLFQVLSADDYPEAAVRANASGPVDFAVNVSPRGAPTSCTVTQSSGAEALDRRTCELVMQRGAFIPATDGSGPLAGIWHGRINWRIEE